MPDHPAEDDTGYGLVMPFLVVRSKGGPYDDEAYAAGYEMGMLDAYLTNTRIEEQLNLPVEDTVRTIRTYNREQADLIAMRHGYIVESALSDVPEWCEVRIRRMADDEETS